MMEYREFLKSKSQRMENRGKSISLSQIHTLLFEWQKLIVRWACHKGRAAIFADTGLGKTLMQLEWARLMGGKCLIIAPLSVARQTVREAEKIGLKIKYVRSSIDLDSNSVCITNYEMFENFDLELFESVVLDESSILKSIGGKTRQKLIKACQKIPFRLCCTATPAPNDFIELGNHAEFLGICTRAEMLAQFFINANKEHTVQMNDRLYHVKGTNKGGQEWRLKHHAEKPFFEWLSSWAMSLTKPSDLGFDDDGFILPPLNINPVFVPVEYQPEGKLFFDGLHGIEDRSDIRKQTIDAKLQRLANLIPSNGSQTIIWVGLNDESTKVRDLTGGIEVKGEDTPESKAKAFEDFQDVKFPILVTKAKIGGFGMNFQNAHNMIFFGLNDSWETWYQCIRREWRYRQEHPVNVHVLLSNLESDIYQNILRKDAQAQRLRTGLIEHVKGMEMQELENQEITIKEYDQRVETGKDWTAYKGDSCEILSQLSENSIDLSVYSPPFVDLFTYTDTERDLGNSRGWGEFFSHYSFIIREVLRVTKPGRLTCVHTSDIPAMAQKDGYIGIKDFPGEVIRAYEKEGWIFHGRAFVQKDPQAQAIRTKSKALLFVQIRKDSTHSRPALIDQILIFRKPGDSEVAVNPVENKELDNETWIEWAHGIWTGIHETDTLQYYHARDKNDEKHVCPLQLPVIERCIKLYSNPGETILTPFGGIGSEPYMALKLNRKAIAIEIKDSYFDLMISNLRTVSDNAQRDLF